MSGEMRTRFDHLGRKAGDNAFTLKPSKTDCYAGPREIDIEEITERYNAGGTLTPEEAIVLQTMMDVAAGVRTPDRAEFAAKVDALLKRADAIRNDAFLADEQSLRDQCNHAARYRAPAPILFPDED